MTSADLTRRIALIAGGVALIGMGTLTAGCSKTTKEAPTTTSPAGTSAPTLSSTEKAVPQKPVPSISGQGPQDASCGAGRSKVNGVCQ